MKEEPDEYCEKIFMVLAIYGETRFNELHRQLIKHNTKMSKPTIIEHLNHLLENEIVQRNQEEKQKVSYQLNWKTLKQLQSTKKTIQTTRHQLKNEKRFKSKSLDQQTVFTTAMLTIGELLYLKMNILNILEPENKLQNYYTYNIIRKFYNFYTSWLLDSCKESKENSQKVIQSIDKSINALIETFFEHHQQTNKTPFLQSTIRNNVERPTL